MHDNIYTELKNIFFLLNTNQNTYQKIKTIGNEQLKTSSGLFYALIQYSITIF